MADINKELFEGMVKAGFEPLRVFIESKRLEEDISEKDIEKVMEVIGYNLFTWAEWLRHQKMHARDKFD